MRRKDYVVAGWASVNEGTEGPPIWDVVMSHIEKKRVVAPKEAGHVRVVGNLKKFLPEHMQIRAYTAASQRWKGR